MAEFMTGPSDVLSDILKNIRQKQFEKHVIKKLADYPWTYYAKRISNKRVKSFSADKLIQKRNQNGFLPRHLYYVNLITNTL